MFWTSRGSGYSDLAFSLGPTDLAFHDHYTDKQDISGLFAGGEVTGGVIGTHYVGSGNSYANALVFGRTAGRIAPAEVTMHRA